MKNKKSGLWVSDMMPFFILLLFVVVFAFTTGGSVFSGTNIKNLFSQSMSTIICALGMVFVSAMGATDITVGSLLAMATVFGSVASASGNWLLFIPVTLITGIGSGLLMGVINAKFKVPSFMASLALLISYRAVVNLLLKSTSYNFLSELGIFNSFGFTVAAVIVLTVIVIYIFHYTPFGTYVRGIGENENAMVHAGVNVNKIKILAFTISGLMAAVAGIFMTARVGGVNNTLGSGFEMKVMMAMFIGGMPVEGGMGTKIYKVLLGAFTITLLENGLILSGVDGNITQLVKGLVLLAVIYISIQVNEKYRFGVSAKNKVKVVA